MILELAAHPGSFVLGSVEDLPKLQGLLTLAFGNRLLVDVSGHSMKPFPFEELPRALTKFLKKDALDQVLVIDTVHLHVAVE